MATYQCARCSAPIRTLDDEYGDHGCGRCGWEPKNSENETEDDTNGND